MNETVVMLFEVGLQRIKPRSWNNGWQDWIWDALEHAQEFWTWCGGYRAAEGRGWAGSWAVWRKEKEESNLSVNYESSQAEEVSLRDSQGYENIPFWASFLNESIKNLDYSSHWPLRAICPLGNPFSPFLLSKDTDWCLLRDLSRALGCTSLAQCQCLPSCWERALSKSWLFPKSAIL